MHTRITNLDVYRAANLLIRQHGGHAEIEAARKADLMLDRNDRDGQLVWLRIGRAIVELQAPQNGPAGIDAFPRGAIARHPRRRSGALTTAPSLAAELWDVCVEHAR